SADHRGGVEAGVQNWQVRERVAGLERNAGRIAMLVTSAEEHAVVLARFEVESDVSPLPVGGLGHELLKDPVAAGRDARLVRQRVEEVHDLCRGRVDQTGRNRLVRERLACGGIEWMNRGASKIPNTHGRRWHVRARSAVDSLAVRTLIVTVEEQLPAHQ